MANDSSRKIIFCFTVTIVEYTSVYQNVWMTWGFLSDMLLFIVQMMCLSFGQFAKIISLPPLSTVGVMSVLL